MTLRIGVNATAYGANGVEFIVQAEQLGADSAWAPEFWAGDALTPLAYLAASTSRIKLATGVVQISARTPAATAMAFATLEALAGPDRVIAPGATILEIIPTGAALIVEARVLPRDIGFVHEGQNVLVKAIPLAIALQDFIGKHLVLVAWQPILGWLLLCLLLLL